MTTVLITAKDDGSMHRIPYLEEAQQVLEYIQNVIDLSFFSNGHTFPNSWKLMSEKKKR